MSVSDQARELQSAANAFGFELTPQAVGKLAVYLDTLLLWRSRISLTTADTPSRLIREHIADSFALIPVLPKKPGVFVDIGSGAGFPGAPVAVLRPDLHVVLLEARRKRANFLKEVARAAELSNVEVFEGRAETLATSRPQFADVITSRALGSLVELLELGCGLLKPQGEVVAMKGPQGRAEAVPHSGYSGPEVTTYELPGLGHRLLIRYIRLVPGFT